MGSLGGCTGLLLLFVGSTLLEYSVSKKLFDSFMSWVVDLKCCYDLFMRDLFLNGIITGLP